MTSKKSGKAEERIRSGRSNSPVQTGKKGKEAASVLANTDGRRQKVVIWPEWSDADINQEKWDSAQKGGKDKGGGKSPVQQHFFDDPDGKIIMPHSLPVFQWKRPAEVFPDKIPVVVDPEHQFNFDIMRSNNHILHSETMRWIISQVDSLWKINMTKATGSEPPEIPISPEGMVYNWRPWEHIYAITKIGKGPNIPSYNAYGKYVVKLFWMGCWRKITIDDSLPFDENDNLLLPASTVGHELWPMLLTKALLKVASLDYGAGSGSMEFGDFSIIHCCTSWLPQTIIVNKNQPNQVWKLLQNLLPEWKLPDPEKELSSLEEEVSRAASQVQGTSPDTAEPKQQVSSGKEKKEEKSAGKGKDQAKEKKEPVVKEKKGGGSDEHQPAVATQPEVAVFASYHDVTRKQPFSVMSMSEMADHSETLRREGFSYLYSHPVLLNKFRSCPLTPPTPPEVVPAWKQIRPLIKKPLPTSEEHIIEAEENKPIQSIHLESPFVNYNTNVLLIPTSTSRPCSSLQRGGTRPTTPAAPSIDEDPPEDPEITALNRMSSVHKHCKDQSESERQEQMPDLKEGPKDEIPSSPADGKKGHSSRRRQSTVLSNKPKLSSLADQTKLTTPTTQQLAAEEASPEEGADKEEEEPKEPIKPRDMWIDVDKFCQCFQAIHVYHKTNTYQYTKTFVDMKHVANYAEKEKKESKKPSAGNVTAISSGDERQPQYLFVDSLKPVDVIFCMSALCRWNEPQLQSHNTGAQSITGRSTKDEGSVTEDDIQSIREGQLSEANAKPVEVTPGSMIAEWHYWKTIKVGNLFKRMKSTGVKAVSLRLPEGRHCLKMYIRASLGYHIQLVSSSPFIFGEEETVIPHLVKDPVRLLDYGTKLIQSLGKLISCFSDEEAREQAQKEYENLYCPHSIGSFGITLKRHTQVYNQALNQTMRSVVGDKANADINFAWRVLTKDCTTPNPLGANYSSGKPDTTSAPSVPEGKPGKGDSKKESVAPPPPPAESDEKNALNVFDPNEITSEQLVAAIKLQKAQRGHRVRRVMRGVDPNSKDHQRVADSLLKVWNLLETQSEQIGLQLLKTLFSLDPGLMPLYSFASDEENHITYVDYNGSFTEHQANEWFIVFREVFHINMQAGCCEPYASEIMLLPKLYTPIPTCCLRVVDNDTGIEFERTLGEKMPPLKYKKNEKGYTFLAVARSLDTPQPAGKWRLRLISDSYRTMPTPNRNDLCSQFHVRELRDYYMPNNQNIAMRQIVRVQSDMLLTFELKLSKPDVTVCLQILDKEEELLSATGRGHVILPAYLFQADITPEEDGNTSGSRSSSRARRAAKSNTSRKSSSNSSGEWKTHKYVIQAIIETDAWPLSVANWAFVETLRQQEKEEMKSNGKPREPSPPKAQETKKETPVKGGKGGKAPAKGGAKDKGGKDSGSRPESVTFDITKAHWTLKAVVDASSADDLSLRKDTDRADQVRAMKKAWEELEPGRAERAKQSRLRYLSSRMLEQPPSETVPETPAPVEAGATTERSPSTQREATLPLPDDVFSLEPPESVKIQAKEPQLAPVDLSPYFRGDPSKATFRSFEELMEMATEEKKKAIEEFKENADLWSEWFKDEKIYRNRSKLKQIELANKLQNDVDKCREAYFRKREAYRIRLLQEELKRQQELEAAELAAQQAALESGGPEPDSKKKASARGKKSPNTAKSSKSSGKKK